MALGACRRAAIAVAVMVAMAIAACGGSDDNSPTVGQDGLTREETSPGGKPLTKDAYQAGIFDALDRQADLTGLYYDIVLPKPQDVCERKITAFHRRLFELIERVAALRPPLDVAPIHEQFVVNARKSVDRVGEVRETVLDGDLRCGQSVNDLVYGLPSSDRAEGAIYALESKGYFVYGQ